MNTLSKACVERFQVEDRLHTGTGAFLGLNAGVKPSFRGNAGEPSIYKYRRRHVFWCAVLLLLGFQVAREVVVGIIVTTLRRDQVARVAAQAPRVAVAQFRDGPQDGRVDAHAVNAGL